MPNHETRIRQNYCEHPTWTEYPSGPRATITDWPKLSSLKITEPNFRILRICNHCGKDITETHNFESQHQKNQEKSVVIIVGLPYLFHKAAGQQ